MCYCQYKHKNLKNKYSVQYQMICPQAMASYSPGPAQTAVEALFCVTCLEVPWKSHKTMKTWGF